MRAWELNEREYISELRTAYQSDHVDLDAGNFNILVHRGNIWIFDPSEDTDNEELINDVIAKLQIEGMEGADLDTITEHIMEERPDVVYGHITDGGDELYLQNHGSISQSPVTSKAIKDIVKHFGIKHVTKMDPGSDNEIITHKHEILGKIPDAMYHGTNSKYIANILKKGVMPTDNVNWQNVKFPKLIFLAAEKNFTEFHAMKQARENKSLPVIVKVKIPEKNKLVLDYDVAVYLYGLDHPEAKSAGYDESDPKYFRNEEMAALIQDVNKGTKLNTQMGIFGYKGRIPATHILEIYIIGREMEDNDEHGVDPDAWIKFTDKNEALEALDMIASLGYYDPDYDPEEDQDWDDEEDEREAAE